MPKFLIPTRPRRFPAAVAGAALALATLFAVPSAAPAASYGSPAPARVPLGFLGTMLGDPVFPGMVSDPRFTSQADLMVSSGVESLRVVFDWSAAQPYQHWSQISPYDTGVYKSDGVDAVPTDFTTFDQLVGAAAQRHLSVLPVIVGAPAWDGQSFPGGAMDIPRGNSRYAAFCQALVRRYGPHGSFWAGFPYKPYPITRWQIWNEPNVAAFWPPSQNFAPRYVGLLRAARQAIRRADPHASIVLAGLANYSWKGLEQIYAVPGARRQFDVVGLHPYTRTPQNVITILGLARRVMTVYGDGRKPMIADEISWPSSTGKTIHNNGYDFDTTEAGQARDIAQVLPLLAANRTRLGLAAVYYYTWAGLERRNYFSFDFSGLLRYAHGKFVRKPAFYAFRHAALALERCHVKGSVANVCRR